MTEKAEEKLKELNQIVAKLQEEANNRVTALNSVIGALQADIDGIKSSQQDAGTKTGSFNNEIQILENNIASEKKEIENLKAKIADLDPKLESGNTQISELDSNVNELKSKKSELEGNINAKTEEKANLTSEKSEKGEALSDLEASIDKDLESYKSELNSVKEELDAIIDDNQVWDYLFEIIETPEVEIMAIIAANRNISLDDIKGKAKSVSPVFVGRAISKLEADGKIVNNDNLWDLSPSVLETISS